MRFSKLILLVAITLLLSSCTSESESEVDLIKNYMTNQNFGFDEESLLIMETNDPDFKLAFLTNEFGPQLITIFDNSVEGKHLIGSEKGPDDTPIYWELSRNDQYEIMAGLIFDDNIINIQIDGVKEEDIKYINYGNVRFFFTSSKNINKNPVTIECYDGVGNLVYTTKPKT